MKKIILLITVGFLGITLSVAQVGINTSTPDESSVLDIVSTSKGVLFPRLTQEARDEITNPAQGLMLFNTDCSALQINTGEASSPNWVNITPCQATLDADLVCTSITTNGTYSVGTALAATNTITVNVNVTTLGSGDNSYTISTDTVNGYSFSSTGTFTSTGVQTITLNGTGTPTAAGTDNFTLTYNGTTCNFNVSPTDAAPREVIIGSTTAGGSGSSGLPVYFGSSTWNEGKSWAAMIYESSDLGESGTISKISFLVDYSNSSSCSSTESNQKVYMKLVDNDTFADANNEDVSQLTQVFSGDVTWVKGERTDLDGAWSEITLDTPFAYDGTKHLLVYVWNEAGSEAGCIGGSWGGPTFLVTPGSGKYKKYSGDTVPDSGSSSSQVPVIRINLQ